MLTFIEMLMILTEYVIIQRHGLTINIIVKECVSSYLV